MDENVIEQKAIEQAKTEYEIYLDLKGIYFNLQYLKPNDRSKRDRSFAIALTELEKLLAYYFMNIVPEDHK